MPPNSPPANPTPGGTAASQPFDEPVQKKMKNSKNEKHIECACK
jgi:hypothetical protein